MLNAQNVSRSFRSVKAVSELSFCVDTPGIVALLGANGAGKTTTMRMLTGAIRPDAGRMMIGPRRADPSQPSARRDIGFLSEQAAPYPEMTPMQYLRYRARLYGVPRSDRARAVADALTRCELGGVEHRRIGALSKGYRQRVGLAAALLHDPAILILDEPTSGLDPKQTRAFRSMLAEIATDKVVLLSTHILAEVEAVASRVLILAHGRLVYDGPVSHKAEAVRTVRVLCGPGPGGLPVPTDRARLCGRLLAIDQIAEVEQRAGRQPGWHDLRIRLDAPIVNDRLLASIAAAVTDGGRPLGAFTPEVATFEQRFMRLIDGGDAS